MVRSQWSIFLFQGKMWNTLFVIIASLLLSFFYHRRRAQFKADNQLGDCWLGNQRREIACEGCSETFGNEAFLNLQLPSVAQKDGVVKVPITHGRLPSGPLAQSIIAAVILSEGRGFISHQSSPLSLCGLVPAIRGILGNIALISTFTL